MWCTKLSASTSGKQNIYGIETPYEEKFTVCSLTLFRPMVDARIAEDNYLAPIRTPVSQTHRFKREPCTRNIRGWSP